MGASVGVSRWGEAQAYGYQSSSIPDIQPMLQNGLCTQPSGFEQCPVFAFSILQGLIYLPITQKIMPNVIPQGVQRWTRVQQTKTVIKYISSHFNSPMVLTFVRSGVSPRSSYQPNLSRSPPRSAKTSISAPLWSLEIQETPSSSALNIRLIIVCRSAFVLSSTLVEPLTRLPTVT